MSLPDSEEVPFRHVPLLYPPLDPKLCYVHIHKFLQYTYTHETGRMLFKSQIYLLGIVEILPSFQKSSEQDSDQCLTHLIRICMLIKFHA